MAKDIKKIASKAARARRAGWKNQNQVLGDTHVISVRLAPGAYKRLRAITDRHNSNVTALTRYLLDEFIEQYEEPEPAAATGTLFE